jgi:hypothetical protein
MPEEDKILVEYVRQFGAWDWSSIRCKGLLPRTGKSCHLQWVNKLKPDLKGSSSSPSTLTCDQQCRERNYWQQHPNLQHLSIGCTALKNLHWKKIIVQFGDLPAPGYFKKFPWMPVRLHVVISLGWGRFVVWWSAAFIWMHLGHPWFLWKGRHCGQCLPPSELRVNPEVQGGMHCQPAVPPPIPLYFQMCCVWLNLWVSFFGSCRSGCKFSSEEERLVVEMQAKLGNKWAKIDSCLPGRTDNDVKNFWSTRQKRIWRALQQPKMMMMVTSARSTDVSADTSDLSKGRSLSEFSTFQVSLKGKLLPYLFKWCAKNII